MKILVIGSGGREHALCWKIAKSKEVSRLFAAPGNAGISAIADCVSIKQDDIAGFIKFAKENEIDLTVVGPEASLVAGIVDAFEKEKLHIFGQPKSSAQLEGSKAFAKELMRKHKIPTAKSERFSTFNTAFDYVSTTKPPVVIKADGLAAGKGVVICNSKEEAADTLNVMLKEHKFGKAGDTIIVEEFLTGEEASIIAVTDSRTIAVFESAQDYKRVFDGDKGPNTGGMGSYSPALIVTRELLSRIEKEILLPTVHALRIDNRKPKGVIYTGLMITDEGPKVLEYNVRFGDPETQPLLVRLKSDLVQLLQRTVEGKLEKAEIEWDKHPAVCVVLASGGYPAEYKKGFEISGLDNVQKIKDVVVFHAGTSFSGNKIVTSGGRVLGVTATGKTIEEARNLAYKAVSEIHFEGMHYRKDIAERALLREKKTGKNN
ncbi:MAG: phosphoribosylamine--glycine ligase [Planctomycetota bacterium]